MTVPDRIEAARLLRSLEPPDWLLRHSRAVAEVAAFLAARTAQHGGHVDRTLAETAALMHDTDKALPATDPLRRLPHGYGSARWLAERGHDELGPAVEHHPVTRLLDGAWFDAWLRGSRLEDRIVAYAANSDSLWPGAIVSADSVVSGFFTQVVLPRAPVRETPTA